MNSGKLPRTDSIEELARFWDSHDVTDFGEKLEEVPGPVFEREAVVVVRLSSGEAEAEAVKSIARSKGIGDAELIHEWVAEKVRHCGF